MQLLHQVAPRAFVTCAPVDARPFPVCRTFGALLLAGLLLLATACGRDTPAAEPAAGEAAPTATTAAPATPTTAAEPAPTESAAALPADLPVFDITHFTNPTTITNTWMPLIPGAHFVYEGTTIEDDGAVVPHRIEVIITGLTKAVGGLATVVSWDRDYTDGELVEAELAFYAQDDAGNVWRMGEYPEEYDAGQVVAAPTWLHGLADAHAGIHMQADPQPGTPSYAQGWGPAVGWTDRGQVDQVGQESCVPVDCYQNVLVIAETSQSELDAFQLKYYAPNVGNVRVGWRGEGEKTQEVLELTAYAMLSPEALEAANAEALALEVSAYANSKDVYAQTPPIPGNEEAVAAAAAAPGDGATEIVVYTADLPEEGLYELELWEDEAAAEGELLGVTNNGDELDAPPENDPHATFTVAVQAGVPYRCWVHMLVGAPQGKSQANLLWVQFSGAVDQNNQAVYVPESASFLTVQGPTQAGWAWAPCALAGATDPAAALITFANSGEVTVRIQAGMEGVGFDQFLLSAGEYLENAPSDAVVEK